MPVKHEPLEAPKANATAKAKALPAIPSKEASNMMKHMKRLEKKGDNQLLQQYSNCKTQQDKRAFFYTVYQLDPRVSKKDVLKQDKGEESHKVEINDDWFPADQIAADKGILPHNPNYLNFLNACTAGLEERPHESPALAKMGVMQYKYAMVKKTKTHLQTRALNLEEKVEDVATDNFEEMRSALAGPAPKKTISKKEEKEQLEMLKDETAPEDSELDKAQAEYQLSWRKCKTAMTAITAEISGLEMVLSQLHALPDDGTSGKMKQAYIEQSEKSSAALDKMKKDAVAKFSAFPGKGKWDSLSQADFEDKGKNLFWIDKEGAGCCEECQEAGDTNQKMVAGC